MLCCAAVVSVSIERTYLRCFIHNTHTRRWFMIVDSNHWVAFHCCVNATLSCRITQITAWPVSLINQLTSDRWEFLSSCHEPWSEVSVRICNDWSDWSSVSLTAYSHYFLHNWFIIPVAGIERHWFFPSSRSITVDKQVFVLERLGRSPLEAIFTISLGFLVRQIFWYSNT